MCHSGSWNITNEEDPLPLKDNVEEGIEKEDKEFFVCSLLDVCLPKSCLTKDHGHPPEQEIAKEPSSMQ